ncbi:ABC exporter membrane fusion protein [Anabaena sp. FACHB-1237]|uniref:ABC exporter membrane fusion protein n=1 Tax=Anabaena sp. FACHB-1237 TaxID=2692769 RepID=UPI00167FE3CE|nr:ABC exporter membrane fusion protein [Anabaena sp. FACHB-1237]MBD2139688.1 ABC exporter membrane fusion protein [Anabaena sp. FACHB-1237]
MQNHKQGLLSSQLLLRLTITLAISASLFVVVVSVITLWIFRYSDDQKQQKSEISSLFIPKIETVTALGKIQPEGEVIKVSAAVSGEGTRVQKILVKEGEIVKKGQIMAILDNSDRLEIALTQAQAEVKVMEANLAKIKAGAKIGEMTGQQAIINRLIVENQGDIQTQITNINTLETEVLNSESEYQRYQELYSQGAISASQKDDKYVTLQTTKNNLKSAKFQLNKLQFSNQQKIAEASAKLQQISEVRKVDVDAAIAELNRSLVMVKQAKINLENAYVRSPENGQILEIHSQPGELISNDGIMDIGKTSQMYVIAEVYESDIHKVKLGQKVNIFNDALNEELFGHVAQIGLQVKKQNFINTDATSNIDSRVIKVRIKLNLSSTKKAAKLTNMQVKVVIQL